MYGKNVNEIETPALVIDFDVLKDNIEKMSRFLKLTSCSLRPHFKTHKSVIIARLQMQAGAIGITCAKLGEAEELVNSGIDNILIANQVVDPQKLKRLAGLARYSTITVAVDSLRNVEDLSSAAVSMNSIIGVLIEADSGMGRCGVRTHEEAVSLAEKISVSPGLILKGIMGYEGHCVWVENYEEREKMATAAIHTLLGYRDYLESRGYKIGIVSCAGTGTYNISSLIPGVTEIQAGSYVFMDAVYSSIEKMDFANALHLWATITSLPQPGTAIIDSGMKSLSTDNGVARIVGADGIELIKLSEEHGTVTIAPGVCDVKVGDRVKIMPSHCCTTVNLHSKYYVISNDTVIGMWNIDGRGKIV